MEYSLQGAHDYLTLIVAMAVFSATQPKTIKDFEIRFCD
jgi:hypothetical protein